MKLLSLSVLLFWTTLLYGQKQRYQLDIYPDDSIKVKTDIFASLKPHGKIVDFFSINKLSENNIFYDAFSKQLKVDVYSGPKEVTKRPLILILGGDALHFGGRQNAEVRFLSYAFARKGYVVASMNYRLAQPNSNFFLESLYLSAQDVRAAMSYFRENAEDYGINQDRIILSGIGDGAMAMLNAVYSKYQGEELRILEEKFGCLDCLNTERRPYFPPFTIISIAGAMIDTSMLKKGKRIPMILFQGAWDKVVNRRYAQPYETQVAQIETTVNRYNQSLMAKMIRDIFGVDYHLEFVVPPMYGSIYIKERLDALGVKNEYHELPKKGHSLILSQSGQKMESADQIVSKSATFIWSSLRDSAKIVGPDTVFSRVETYRTSRTAYYLWNVEGGKIIDSTGTEITVKWDLLASDYAINLSTWDEMGVYNIPTHKNIEFVKTKSLFYLNEVLPALLIILALLVLLFYAFKLKQKKAFS